MLKRRIIPLQLLKSGRLVKSVCFSEYRDVGDPVSSTRIHNSQYADELIFLNIERSSIEPLLELIDRIAAVSFMPLSMGGGISSFEDAAALISQGADKVVLNTLCYRAPEVIARISETFGAQAVIVAIDVRYDPHSDEYRLYSNGGQDLEPVTLSEHISHCESHGAGELLIQSIDQDGRMKGYDLPLLSAVAKCTRLPVIACGGSGNYDHLKEAFLLSEDIGAVACGSLFNFSDSNLIRAKAFLSNYDIPFKKV